MARINIVWKNSAKASRAIAHRQSFCSGGEIILLLEDKMKKALITVVTGQDGSYLAITYNIFRKIK